MSILEMAGKANNGNILADAGLNWSVELSNCLHAPCPSTDGFTTDKRATVRTDNGRVLGIVGENYQIVQNEELVYMAETITKNSAMQISTAGELNGGGRVWLAVKAESFDVTNGDQIDPYLLLTNGHDGLHALGATPTSVRVICENTLNMAISRGRKAGFFISIRHKGNMASKIESLMNTLGEFYVRSVEFSNSAKELSYTAMRSDEVSRYFNNVYDALVKKVDDSSDDRSKTKKQSTLLKWYTVFDAEATQFGSNAWTAMNAVTNWLDHGVSYRGENKTENRFSSNIFGTSAEKKHELLRRTVSGQFV